MKNLQEMINAISAGEILKNINTGNEAVMENGDLVATGQHGKYTVSNIVPQSWEIKKRTVLVNGVEVPEPVRGSLKKNQQYYYPGLSGVCTVHYGDDQVDKILLDLGLIHLSFSDAEIHRDALYKPTRLH
ncbi:MAG TPA: hypothetical protein VK141_02945 [Nitrosomonas sp.]|nr:hypothetical protein [Nitrosomonas sp.]